ncbi:putative NAD(P)/FAD-binding protein YdhS [Neorhizobium galegae]|uniref:FAD/NAD(P)-binding protein n=1 Tax=Rhizobium/Agrobacterium group TaxID=227290 RepID=UPI001AEB393A|nr:FAD/NAD(P)-binding protein [Neorhizobium galegae]MBP2550117.1 putative NAD(P)/FAD-binding protein YdhS [Neorhizobium galegae]
MKYDVAVVGAGFSAIAVTINLMRQLPASARIAVVGDDPGFGRGTAYRSEFHLHRLNVPAARMSIDPEAPDDFLTWLHDHDRAIGGHDFAPRSDFGLYLRDRLAALLRERDSRAKVDFIKAKAVGCLDIGPETTLIRLDNGDGLAVKATVLCLGVGAAPLPLPGDAIAPSTRAAIVENPWRLSWLSKVGRHDRVCMLGSGLTMVDQVLALRATGHRGQIHVLSRRGLLPHAHEVHHAAAVPPDLPHGDRRLSALLAHLRRKVREGAPWRAVMDGLRPHTQRLWQELDEAQKARFLRHGLAWWTVHRHRLAPDVGESLKELVAQQKICVHAGYLNRIEATDPGVTLSYRKRATSTIERLTVDWVVNCTGMERAGIRHSPLLQAMAGRGQLQGDPLGLGIVVNGQSQLIARNGETHRHIYVVGALTAGRFWEITAVPDIRVQAHAVARDICGALEMAPA